MLKKILSLLSIIVFFPDNSFAFGFSIVDQKFETVKSDARIYSINKIESKKEIDYIVTQDVSVDSNISTQIPINSPTGILYFNLFSLQKTKLRLTWAKNAGIYSRVGDEIKFDDDGISRQISFNVTKPHSGYINVYNLDNKLIKRVPYKITKQSPISQSVFGSVYQTRNNNNNPIDNINSSARLSYSMSQRVKPGDPRWSLGVSVGTEFNGNNELDGKSAGVNFGYSW